MRWFYEMEYSMDFVLLFFFSAWKMIFYYIVSNITSDYFQYRANDWLITNRKNLAILSLTLFWKQKHNWLRLFMTKIPFINHQPSVMSILWPLLSRLTLWLHWKFDCGLISKRSNKFVSATQWCQSQKRTRRKKKKTTTKSNAFVGR